MQRGAQGRNLAHRAIAEILAVDMHRGKNKRQRRRCQHVVGSDRHRDADAPRALPRLHARHTLKKGHRLAGGVARTGHADRGQVAAVDCSLDRREIEPRAQQFRERRVVEQRHVRAPAQAAAEQRGERKARGVEKYAGRVGAVDVMRMKVLPHRHQLAHAAPEIAAIGGEHRRIHGTGGGAGDDRKRIAYVFGQQFRYGAQHPDLVRGTRAATGQDQTDLGPCLARTTLSIYLLPDDRIACLIGNRRSPRRDSVLVIT